MSWHVLPSKRSPAVDDRPPLTPPSGGTGGHSNRTSVFMQLCRLLTMWRDDPDKLAVAMSAWCLAGFPGWNAIPEVASGDSELGVKYITDEQAEEIILKALRGRQSRLLRARGEGLLLGLEQFAQDAGWAQLHRVQVDAGVIECRALGMDERIEKLRDMEARSEGMAGSPPPGMPR